MALLEIIIGADNPLLRRESMRVKNFDSSLKKFVKDLKETMMKKDGLGLAAPQVGENVRVIVVTLNYKEENVMVVPMVNPVILSHDEEVGVAEEGCLSLPGVFGNVERWTKIVLEFVGLNGEKGVLRLEGLNARVVQHEIDHLDGMLFVDRMKEGEEEENLVM